MKLIITAILITCIQLCQAQLTLNIGPELGVSASQFPQKETYSIQETDEVTEKITPLVSPVVGLHGQLLIKNHLQLTVGIQYQMIGIRETSHREGRVPRVATLPEMYTYTFHEREAQTFHKLCLPVTIGYVFNRVKLKPSVFVGIRPNLFLAGKYAYVANLDATDDSQDGSWENEYNPVSPNQAGWPLERVTNQVLLGVSVLAGERLKINAIFHAGWVMNYSEGELIGWEPNFTVFSNSDFGISAVYFFSR